jgi:YHS domain-containing protein
MKPTYSMIAAISILAIPSLRAEEVKKEGDKKGGEVVKKEEVKPYKPDICVVSGEKLGDMGEPVVFVYQGQEIKLCCKGCRKKFDKDPAKYLKKLAETK